MTNRTRTWALPTVFILISLLAGTSCSALESLGILDRKPNVIVILTDDMDLSLVPYMPHMQELIAEQGAVFTNYFVTSPLCCPSRASMIRGQYPHNTNIMENAPGFRNFYRNKFEDETIAVWLSRAGYRTALMGKYMNGYPVTAGNTYVPPGWTDWNAYVFNEAGGDERGYYFSYILNENGELFNYGDAPEEYSTDVFRQKSLDFIDQSVSARDPFFLLISTTAPHGPSVPAPRHEGVFTNLEYPRTPSFLVPDGKPAVVLEKATVPGEEFDYYDADAFFTDRAATLLAVDEMIVDIFKALETSGQLDNTYVIFTSDNGFHLGEHGLSGGKGLPYTEDIHVPFFMRGPGIAPGTTVTQLTTNIDLAPTLAEIAGAQTADFVDGRSLMPLLRLTDTPLPEWRDGFLIEAGYTNREDSRALIFRGIRTQEFLYVEYVDGTVEFYDLAADPYETKNLAPGLDPASLSALDGWLESLKTCKADACRAIEMDPPEIKY